MSELQFAWPWYWPAVTLLLLVPFVVRRQQRGSEEERARWLGARAAVLIGVPANHRLRAWLGWLALLALAVALLQPVVPGRERAFGADVVLCVDVSASMAARDVAPSRGGAAATQIARMVANAPQSRFALIAFTGTAELVTPRTNDGEAVAAMAQELQPGFLAQGGTDPGAALRLAGELLADKPGGAVVLVGDGEDFVGGGEPAAAALWQAGHRVHALGLGDEHGSKIPIEADGGEVFLRDGHGVEVTTHLEREALQRLCAAGGGRCVVASNGDELLRLHDDVLLPAARASALQRGELAAVPCFHVPLLLALLFWMLRRTVPEFRR